jgi:hypothetical protein
MDVTSMQKAGLVPTVTDVQRWPVLPTPRPKMATQFRAMSDSELTVHQFDCIARIDSGRPSA